jgi:hypothetical protein
LYGIYHCLPDLLTADLELAVLQAAHAMHQSCICMHIHDDIAVQCMRIDLAAAIA